MNPNDQDRLKKLLQQALPPIDGEAEPAHDLWPAVLKRLNARQAPPWYDWALAAGVVAIVAVFPAWIPVLLYYL
ncbi:MAG: hypothetical protein WBE76_00800 [Terracidiphilus sp.]